MDELAKLFCVGFLGFYSLVLLAVVLPPLIRHVRRNVPNRRQARPAETLNTPAVREPQQSS